MLQKLTWWEQNHRLHAAHLTRVRRQLSKSAQNLLNCFYLSSRDLIIRNAFTHRWTLELVRQVPWHTPLCKVEQEELLPGFLQQKLLIGFRECLKRHQTTHPSDSHKQETSRCFLWREEKRRRGKIIIIPCFHFTPLDSLNTWQTQMKHKISVLWVIKTRD